MTVFADNPALAGHWYVVAATAELGRAPIAVELLRRAFVIWRDDEGVARAAPDRCPHREAPLSCGSIDEGRLTCSYHGWRFGGDGRCVEVPSSDPSVPIPPAAHLQTVATEERYGLVWICPGTPTRPIPTMPWDDDERFRRINTGVDEWAVSATRMTDNFMDISHFPWVHTGTFGAGQTTQVPHLELAALDDDWFGYAYEVDANNPEEAAATTTTDEPVVHRWMTTGFSLPFNVRSTIRYADGLEHILLLATTPIDDERSYFSFVVWRNDDHATDPEEIISFDRAIGAEDKTMLERVPGVLSLDRTGLASVQSDKPSVEWRRRFVELLDDMV
jgi:phenylpropionate dioxygenase-like ring-hydroxylating dioxygenase large terminal subunit